MTPSTPTFPEIIDSTMLSAYGACPRKFWYEFVCNLSPGTSIHLHAGAAFARGLEAARTAFYVTKLSHPAALLAGLNAFMAYWDADTAAAYAADPSSNPLTLELVDYPGQAKDFVNMAYALLEYFTVYPLDSDPLQPVIMAGDRPAIEFTFAIPLPIRHPESDNPIIFAGRCDMIAYFRDMITIVDEKTTAAIGPGWARQWSMRGQFYGYVWAAQTYGIEASSALIRGMAIQKTQFKHAMAIEYFAPWQIANWHTTMLNRVHAMVEDYHTGASGASSAWDQSFGDACSAYGGCSFLDLCTVEDPQAWFSTYGRRNWNPLAVDPTTSPAPPAPSTPLENEE